MNNLNPTAPQGKGLTSQSGFFVNRSGRRLDALDVLQTPNPIAIQACEIHVVIGCSDSRDVTNAFNQAAKEIRSEYAQRGIYVELVRENVAGNFITHDVFRGLEAGITDRLQQLGALHAAKIPITVYIHILTHGSVQRLDHGNPALKYTVHELKADSTSPCNCGMRNAEVLAQELEYELLTANPKAKFELVTFGSSQRGPTTIVINSTDDIRHLMREAYDFEGTLSAGWAKSITQLPNHALEQKQILRDLISHSHGMRPLHIKITAGVHNYETHEYFRVDGNTHLETFLDDVFERKRQILGQAEALIDHQSSISPQAPKLGLFHHAFINEPRATAFALHSGEPYHAGTVFAIGSGLAADFHRRQGPYRIVAFYYGVRHLKLKDWIVLGRDQLETMNMVSRITNDPLMNWIMTRNGVELHRYSLSELNMSQLQRVQGVQEPDVTYPNFEI